MRFAEYYQDQKKPHISFELFPPKTERGLAELHARLPGLISLEPSFLTVTYGALGSTRDRTLELACLVQQKYGKDCAHHLTCLAASRPEIDGILRRIRDSGIANIVALRGDPPKGETEFRPPEDGFLYANELVERIRDFGHFGIAVAGYPEKHVEASTPEQDLQNLKRKVAAGADAIFTQLFYDNRHYYRFVERCREMGITQPIIPGLMPLVSLEQINRIVQMCGATIPPELMGRVEQAGAEEIPRLGIEYTTQQVIDLLEHKVPGIHFYVLNQCVQISEILNRVRSSSAFLNF